MKHAVYLVSVLSCIALIAAQPVDTDTHSPKIVPDGRVSSWPFVLARLMIALYTIIAFLSLLSIIRIYQSQYKLLSFRCFFLALSLIWTVLRVAFFLLAAANVNSDVGEIDRGGNGSKLSDSIVTRHRSHRLHLLLDVFYYGPSACQLMMFSQLLLFYAKLYHTHHYEWKSKATRCLVPFIVLNVLYCVITLVFIAAIQINDIPSDSTSTTETHAGKESVNDNADVYSQMELYHQIYFMLSSLFFFVLFIVALVYFYLLYFDASIHFLYHSHHLLLALVIFFILLSRCCFDFAAALNFSASIFRRQIYETERGVGVDGGTFVLLFVWEILPVIIVITKFKDGPINQTHMHQHSNGMIGSGGGSAEQRSFKEEQQSLVRRWLWWLPFFHSTAAAHSPLLTQPVTRASDDTDNESDLNDEEAFYYDDIDFDDPVSVNDDHYQQANSHRHSTNSNSSNLSVFAAFPSSLLMAPQTRNQEREPFYKQYNYQSLQSSAIANQPPVSIGPSPSLPPHSSSGSRIRNEA